MKKLSMLLINAMLLVMGVRLEYQFRRSRNNLQHQDFDLQLPQNENFGQENFHLS